jgi:hypothetical protein
VKTNPTRALTVAAGLVIVALTAAAFWLSYAHLAEVALAHGMEDKEIRAWAWPATLDLFIVAGELLMLRAALARRVDWWAIGLTVAGSGGSIALNVAGVGSSAELLDYVVAAVPPTAALLAFGALMRQVHQALAGRMETVAVTAAVTVERVDDDQTDPEVERVPEAYPAIEERVPAVPEAVPAGVRLLPIVARTTASLQREAVAAKVPRTRPEVRAEYVPEKPAEDPATKRARVRFGDLLAEGRTPSIRQLRETYSVGQARAKRIQDELKGAL